MNIKGHYIIKIGKKTIKRDNLITFLGESFFLNRMINDGMSPITHIALGSSKLQAKRSDLTLGNETIRKRCVTEARVEKKQIVLSCSCTTGEVLNTSEIGVVAGDILISHDIYTPIDTEFLGDNVGEVDITYTFDLNTLTARGNWEKYTQINEGEDYNIYYIVEENNVKCVIEEDSNSGYHAVHSLNDLKTTNGAYFYDENIKMLFLKTIRNDNPNLYKISIMT